MYAASERSPFTPHTITDSDRLYAEIDKARTDGYAVVEQQLQIGVRGIAVPLKDRRGRAVAALSMSIPMAGESTAQALERVLSDPQPAARIEMQFRAGMKVRHSAWGDGIVLTSRIQDNDETVDVVFESVGIKRLAASLANLTILKDQR